jgi:stress response protein YsnF
MVREGQRDISREKESETIELAEERLVVEKVVRPRERVVVRIVPVQREERVDVMLEEESVEIERVEVNRRVDAAPSVREESGVVIIPVVEEVLVVETHLILREEIRVHRRHEHRREQQIVTLRSEEAHVEREGEEKK